MRKRGSQLARFLLCYKKDLFSIAIFFLLFSFIPLHVAQAGFWDGLIDVVVGIMAKVLEFFAKVLGEIFTLVAGVLMTAITFIMGLGVTPGAPNTPAFVDTAWNIVRNFVNMFFILILAFIGLATILRLETYELKKTLPWLIIMALLINFSGVFVGFIVDMSNLTTNVFLDMARQTGAGFGGSNMNPSFAGEGASSSPESRLAVSIAQILYYIVAIIIYMLLILVFLIRIMFLWVLTILSPLAFASYILPATRSKIWSEWWKQLVQWSIFVIPMSLFLWLSGEVLAAGGGLPAGINSKDASFLAEFLAPFTALFILYIGVMTSQQMAPAAANAVVNFGKGIGGKMALSAGSAAWRFRGAPGIDIPKKEFTVPILGKKITLGGKLGLEKGFGESLEGAGQWLRRKSSTISQKDITQREIGIAKSLADVTKRKTWLEGEKETMDPREYAEKNEKLEKEKKLLDTEGETLPGLDRKGLGKALGALPMFAGRWIGRGVEIPTGMVTRGMKSKDEREIGEGVQDGTGKDSKDIARQINMELAKGALKNQNRIVGLLNAMVKNGDSDDIQQYMREGTFDPKQIGSAIADAQRAGPPAYRPLMKSMYGRMLSNPDQFGQNFKTEK